jgi:hypothetical protein
MKIIRIFCLYPIGFLSLFVSLNTAQATDNLDIPDFKQGEWEMTNTLQPKGQEPRKGGIFTFECTQPALSLKREITALEKSGCKVSSMTRVGAEYGYVVSCGARGANHYTLKVHGLDAFTQTVLQEHSGNISLLTAHRIGNCKSAAQPSVPADRPQTGAR